MEQEIKRLYYPSANDEIKYMKNKGYIIKQISGSSTSDYVWVLFEKNINIETDNTI